MSKFKKSKFSKDSSLARVIGLTSKSSDARILYKVAGKQKKERVPKFDSIKDRKIYVEQRIFEINQLTGADYFNSTEKTFIHLIDEHLKSAENSYRSNQLRYDTYRTYKTMANNSKQIISALELNKKASEIRKKDIIKLLEYVIYQRKVKPRTRNNYLNYLSTVFLWGVDREIVEFNPCLKIPKLANTQKVRKVIPEFFINEILNYFKKNNKPFFVLCLVEYYCFIRRTELTKLKVKHIKIKESVFSLPGEITKNKKHGIVTIPDSLMKYLIDHIKYAKPDNYLFSETIEAGTKKMHPTKITNTWNRMRNKIDLPKEYQFYSLKDTGITKLFKLGIPTIKIRDQARHHDIKITETYTPRNYEFDNLIKSLKDDF